MTHNDVQKFMSNTKYLILDFSTENMLTLRIQPKRVGLKQIWRKCHVCSRLCSSYLQFWALSCAYFPLRFGQICGLKMNGLRLFWALLFPTWFLLVLLPSFIYGNQAAEDLGKTSI